MTELLRVPLHPPYDTYREHDEAACVNLCSVPAADGVLHRTGRRSSQKVPSTGHGGSFS